jgi:hypothetical protein
MHGVSESISQLKWLHFNARERKLKTFEKNLTRRVAGLGGRCVLFWVSSGILLRLAPLLYSHDSHLDLWRNRWS